jgi:glycosyltransferase involved in cell wall biosynthesis/SAM-dependent methyltransferase
MTFEGWALDGANLPLGVDVAVGNNPPIRAYIGIPRPDIPIHLDSPVASQWSGWRADVDLRTWPEDAARIRVTAIGDGGTRLVLLDRGFSIRSDGFAGHLTHPVDGSVIRSGVLVVDGWVVLDGGLPATIGVMVNGTMVGNARLRLSGPDVPEGVRRKVGDFAGFRFDECPPDTNGADASVDVVVTSKSGSVVRLPTRHVSFAAARTSPEESARAALLRSRSLVMDRRRAREATVGTGQSSRLLVFTDGLGLDDGEGYVPTLLAGVMQHIASCVVVSPTDGPQRHVLERIGVEVMVSGRTQTLDLEGYEGTVRQLVPFIVRSNSDIVLLNTLNVWAEADAAQRAGVPTLWSIHESFRMADWLAQFGGRACHPYVAERLPSTLAAATKLIFDTDAASTSFAQFARSDCRVTIARGVDVESIVAHAHAVDRAGARRQYGIADDSVVLLCAGSYEQTQSPAAVAEAFIDVASTDAHAVLLMVGDHSERYSQALHRMIWASGLAGRILLQPIGTEIRNWYALADVLVVASDTEAPRQSILEAMAASVPALSSSVNGAEDVISDGTNGWLFPPRDTRALATAMKRVLALRPDVRGAIATAARETVRARHSPSRLGAEYARLIRDVMHRPARVAEPSREVALHRLDEALSIFQALAETHPPESHPSNGSTDGDGPLTEFNSSAPFVREGIATFVAAMAAGLSAGARVIDIGAGDAPYRELFSHVDYITVDWEQSPHDGAKRSNIIASAEALPLDDASVDAVLMTEVLEHISDPSAALEEMARVLRPHGEIALTVPFVWILHEMPHDYFRYTPPALTMLLEGAGFEKVVVTPRGDYFSTLAQLMQMTPQWITSIPSDDGLDDRRNLAGRTLADLSGLFAALAPLDRQILLPLGFNVAARRVG